MIRKLLAPLALCVVAACGGNPLGSGGGGGGGDPDPEPTTGIPAAVAKNLTAAGYDPGDPTITVRLRSQDGATLNQVYERNDDYDIPGYIAYTTQASTSNRFAIALTAESGDVKAIQVVDAGQFSSYFAGGAYARSGIYTAPGGGLASYSGTYVGMLNTGVAAPGGPGGTLNPTIADRVTGRALITADFTDMTVSGGVDQRTVVRTGESLVDIALFPTDIASDGTFAGRVERLDTEWRAAGDFAGIFGNNGDNVATVLVFNPTDAATLFEHGMIVLPSCASGGGPACPP